MIRIEEQIVKLSGKLDFGSLAREMKSLILDSAPNFVASSTSSKLNVEYIFISKLRTLVIKRHAETNIHAIILKKLDD